MVWLRASFRKAVRSQPRLESWLQETNGKFNKAANPHERERNHMNTKILKASTLAAAAVTMAFGGPAIAGSGKSGPISTVGWDDEQTAYPGNSGEAPGRCVSEIAKQHKGGGISDKIKELCKLPVSN